MMAGIVVLAASYVLSQFYRSFLAVLTPALIADVGATKADLSMASGLWFVSFAFMQFVVGVSLDRYGPRRTVSLGLGLFAAGGALVFAAATTPWMIIFAMALIGMGCAPVLMASFFILAKTFRPGLFAIGASWIMAVGMLGNVVSASPMAAATEFFGWRMAMAAFALVTLGVAALLYFVVRDPAREEGGPQTDTGLAGYLEIARLKALWLILPFLMLNNVIAAGVRGLWAGPYLIDVHQADPLTIGNVTLVMAFAMVAGSLLYGPLDALVKSSKWVAATGNLLGVLACIYLAFFPVNTIPVTTAMFAVIGLAGSSFGVLIAHARTFFPAHLTGRGVTAMNFFGIGGVGLMQLATGAVVTATTVPGDPAAAYSTLFAFYALAVGGALFIYLFSRDVHPNRPAAQSVVTS